jgi:hypothetical protein
MSLRTVALFFVVPVFAACQPSTTSSQQQQQAQYPQPAPQPYPYGPGQPQPPPPGQPSAPPPPQPPPQTTRALLAPLAGAAAWQQEVRSVLAELIAQLSADKQQKVRGIPLVFDPDPNEVNAYAGCDEQGNPFLAGTEGLLEAVDAMSQTRATDEQFQTQTYEAYTSYAAPRLVQKAGSPALVAGIIAPQHWGDARRFSRAHEMFDEIVAFTFGHELAHHYLGHTGCANGQAQSNGPNPAQIGNLFIRILPGLNQPNEALADINGIVNTLDTGRARAQGGYYRWTEAGGLTLLDFFARMERAAGISPLNPIGFIRTHPNPALRIPTVQTTASTWRMQHPG